MSKRILVLTLGYYPHVGGAEVAIHEITSRTDSSDVVFDMVTLRFVSGNKKIEKIGNVNVYRVGMVDDKMKSTDVLPLKLKVVKIFSPFIIFWKARALHKKHSYDALWVNMANHCAFGALLFKKFYPSVDYVLMLQDGQTYEEVKDKNIFVRFIYPIYLRLFTKADYIHAISNFTKKLAQSMGAKCPIELISNGVNVNHFSKSYQENELEKLRRSLNMKKDKRYIITTSRLVMNRGVEDVIRALNYMPEYVEFLVLGIGSDLEKLKQIANEIGVSGRVHFLGHVDHSELPKYLNVADVFVRPSIIEGFGNSFIEAMVAGVPVVATPIGGIPDFIYDPESNPNQKPTGLFCGVRDPESVAKQVVKILSNHELAESIKKNAKELAVERYDWDTIASSMKKRIFDKVGSSK